MRFFKDGAIGDSAGWSNYSDLRAVWTLRRDQGVECPSLCPVALASVPLRSHRHRSDHMALAPSLRAHPPPPRNAPPPHPSVPLPPPLPPAQKGRCPVIPPFPPADDVFLFRQFFFGVQSVITGKHDLIAIDVASDRRRSRVEGVFEVVVEITPSSPEGRHAPAAVPTAPGASAAPSARRRPRTPRPGPGGRPSDLGRGSGCASCPRRRGGVGRCIPGSNFCEQ